MQQKEVDGVVHCEDGEGQEIQEASKAVKK